MNSKKNLLLFGLMVILFLGTFSIYYPGFMSEDSFFQFAEARSGVYDDNNPPLMAFIWRQVDQIYPGQTGMLALQLILYWGGLYFITLTMDMSLLAGSAFLILVGLYPGTLGILGVIWKDILMMAFMVVAVACYFQTQKGKKKWPWHIATFSFLFLACCLRHNGVFALPPLFAWIFVCLLPKSMSRLRKGLLAVILSLGTSFVFVEGNHFVDRVVLNAKEMNLWALLPLCDLAETYYYLGYIPPGTKMPFQTQKFTYENLRAFHSDQSIMGLLLPFCQPGQICENPPVIDLNAYPDENDRNVALKNLRTLWLSEIVKYPIPYLKHRWGIFAETLGLRPTLWAPVYFTVVKSDLVKDDFNLHHEPTRLQASIRELLQERTSGLFFRMWAALVFNLLVMSWCLWRFYRGYPQNLAVVALGASALSYELPYFFITPGCDYRYSLWFLLATLIFLFLTLRDFLVLRSLKTSEMEK